MLKSFTSVANAVRSALGGLLQIAGIPNGTTRTMTVPDANFTAARTDAAQTFSGVQSFADTTAFQWGGGGIAFTAAQVVGTLGTNGSLAILTPSASAAFGSALGFGGTYDAGTFTSTLNIFATGVRSGGPYNAQLDFHTSLGATLSAKMRITGAGNIHPLTTSSTTMADGFFYIPAAAGVPTGVPTAVSGQVPMYYDSTNNRFYIYNGAWRSVALT